MKGMPTVKPFRPFLVFSPPSCSLVAPRLPLRYGGIVGTMRVKRKKKKADFYLHLAPLPLPSPRFFSASFAENDGDTHHSEP
jgi:hypothetical protein